MLSRRDPDADLVLGVRDDAIGADIDPIAVGVAHHDQIFGSDIAAAVMFMDEGNREFENVHLAVPLHILQNGAGGHDFWRDESGTFAQLRLVALHDVDLFLRRRKAVDMREPAEGICRSRKDAEARGESFDLVEQKRGLFARKAHGQGFGERADLQMRIRPFDQFELSHRFEIFEQVPQIFVRDSMLRRASILRRLQTLIHIVASFPTAKDV